MDLEKQKRNQLIRVVLTEILMVLAIIPIVIFLTLMAMGYRIGEDLSLEQSGLVQVNSLPNGATVKVDGEDKFRTDASRMLTSGEHTLEVSKEGFDSWTKKIGVTPGLLLRVRYPRLFRLERKAEVVATLDDLQWLNAAPNRTELLYQVGKGTTLQLMNIRNDEVKTNTLDLSSILTTNEAGEFIGTLKQIKWSWNGDVALLEIDYADKTEWVLVDVRENALNHNLSRDFGLTITDVQFAGDSTERLYVLENGNLREINLGSNGISRVLLAGVESFSAERMDIGYVGAADGKRVVGVYRNGDAGGVEVTEVEPEAAVRVAVSEYYGEKYLSYTIDSDLIVYEAENFPVYGSDTKRMRPIITIDLEMAASEPIVTNRTGEVILVRGDNMMVAVDLEPNRDNKYEMPVAKTRFIDDYLLYGITDGALTVWDFDGLNKRTLVKEGVLDYGAVISANNKWLYYTAVKDDKIVLMREKIN